MVSTLSCFLRVFKCYIYSDLLALKKEWKKRIRKNEKIAMFSSGEKTKSKRPKKKRRKPQCFHANKGI